MLHGFCNFDGSKVESIALGKDVYVTINMSRIEIIDKRQFFTASLFNVKCPKPAIDKHLRLFLKKILKVVLQLLKIEYGK